MIDRERDGLHGDPERETKAWLRNLTEADGKRARFQDMAAEGLITFDELRAKLINLDEARKAAERELNLLQDRVEHIEALQQDKATVLAFLKDTLPKSLDEATPEERHQLYKMLRIRVTAKVDGYLELKGEFSGRLSVCTSEATRARSAEHALPWQGGGYPEGGWQACERQRRGSGRRRHQRGSRWDTNYGFLDLCCRRLLWIAPESRLQ